MNTNSLSEYLFDHLVIIGRDSLDNLSQKFSDSGFQLTPLARHNLGSINRLIMLNSSYIELLGWEKGERPKRVEIADQPIGLDAIVFRTNDAEACFQKLKYDGFSVNPVQALSRECEYKKEKVLVEFKTVRLQEQPIPGLRIYFCEHLTPSYVWQKQWQEHENQMTCLQKLNIATPDPIYVTNQLIKLLNLKPHHAIMDNNISQIILSNIELSIHPSTLTKIPTEITSIFLSKNHQDPVGFTLNKNFFN